MKYSRHTAIAPSALWELFSYDPLNGHLYWKERHSIRVNTSRPAGGLRRTGYRAVSIAYKRYLHHRLVWAWITGRDPAGLQIDHIDRNRSNDRSWNLRLATNKQNGFNKVIRRNTSGHRGVHWYAARSKWQAYINAENKRVHLGYFTSLEDAVNAYDAALNKFHPECVNYYHAKI